MAIIDLLEALSQPAAELVIKSAADAAEYCGLYATRDVVVRPTSLPAPLTVEMCAQIAHGRCESSSISCGAHSMMTVFDSEWVDTSFINRFGKSLEAVGVPFTRSRVFRAAFGEIIGNAQQHPQTSQLSLATFDVTPSWWVFSVTDFGIGIPSRLRQNRRYSNLSDIDSVVYAIEPGVSTAGGGFGFNDVMRVLVERDARVRIRSGKALLELTMIDEFSHDRVVRPKPSRVGSHVRVGAKI